LRRSIPSPDQNWSRRSITGYPAPISRRQHWRDPLPDRFAGRAAKFFIFSILAIR
jgi:hypothetical protein